MSVERQFSPQGLAFARKGVDLAEAGLVPVDDPAALAEALIAVLADDALRAGYVRSAAEAVRQYDWEVVADDILMVYETVAGSGATVSVGDTPAGRSAATREGA